MCDTLPQESQARYEVSIQAFPHSQTVFYQIKINDLAFNRSDKYLLRFSDIKRLHEQFSKKMKGKLQKIQFPHKNSVFFWRKTNKNPYRIQQRRRQLQFYFSKLINELNTRTLKTIKQMLSPYEQVQRKTKSVIFQDFSGIKKQKALSYLILDPLILQENPNTFTKLLKMIF